MKEISQYVCFVGLLQGLLLSVLLISDRRMTTAGRILGVICLMIALTFSIPLIIINLDIGLLAWILGPLFFLPVALGPLGYLYCRSALLDTRLKRHDVLHAMPVVLCFGLTADISLADPLQMAEWIKGNRPDSVRLGIAEHLPVAIAVAYVVWTGRFIWGYRRQANDNLSNFDPQSFRWLLALQAFSLLVWSFKSAPGLISAPIWLPDLANILLAMFVYCIAIIQWRDPHFFAVPSLGDKRPAASDDRGVSPQAGELDPPTREALFETIRSRLEDDRLYLDSGLTLDRLASSTGVSRHHLSEVLNRHAGKNFYEFINGYRIDFACKRLQQSSGQSVLDIALEAGFSSKSTFNALFKRQTGRTPTQFRRATSAQAA